MLADAKAKNNSRIPHKIVHDIALCSEETFL